MVIGMRKRYDRMLIGWLIGTIVPVLIFMITYQVKYSEMDFMKYMRNLWQMKMFLKVLSLCVYSNLGLFFLFYRMKYDLAARGVIMATFMYAFLVLVVKLI
jgi:hypothetical protein